MPLTLISDFITDTDYTRKPGEHAETGSTKQTETGFQHLKLEKKSALADDWTTDTFCSRFADDKPVTADMYGRESKNKTRSHEGDHSGIVKKEFSSSSRHDWQQASRNLPKLKETGRQFQLEGDLRTHRSGSPNHYNLECQMTNLGVSKETVGKSKHSTKAPGFAGSKLKDLGSKTDVSPGKGLSMESLRAKSLSQSEVESPLTNVDTPSSRYKYFMCRNYGDETYAMTACDLLRNSGTEPVAALSPIRNPELVKKGTALEGEKACSTQQAGEIKVKRETVGNETRVPEYGKTEDIKPAPTSLASQQKQVKQERHSPTFKESKQAGNSFMVSSLSSRLSSLSGRHPHVESDDVDTSANPPYPAMERNLPSINITSAETPTIKPGQTGHSFVITSIASGALTPERKFSHMDTGQLQGASVPKQAVDDQLQKSRVAFSRPPPALMQKQARTVAPSLPVGVAHPYPRASDRGVPLHKAQDHAVTATTTIVSSGKLCSN